MLPTERPDYRRSREAELLDGLRSRDPLALAEAYHRTSPAAHACARRLLGNARDAEALLEAVYRDLWTAPPETARLEGWVRSRCFHVGAQHLRDRGEPPASPSLALLLPDLPPPEEGPHDPAEQALAALPEADRRAALLAHDQGMPTAAQEDPDAAAALDRALLALAGPGEGVDDDSARECADVTPMADWVLGLLAADSAERVTAQIVDRPACAARSRALRRGRRRLEGLPPAPDMGQRILAVVLGGHPGAAAQPGTAAPETEAPRAAEPAAAPPRPAPAPSSLGEAPAAPAPAAGPLPSALDPDGKRAHAEAAGAEPAGAERAGAAADESAVVDTPDGTPGDDTADIPRADAGVGGDGGDEEADATVALAAAEDEEQPVDLEEEEDRHEPTAPTGGQRGLARKILNVLAIVVVVALGGAIGLVIGFLLVGR